MTFSRPKMVTDRREVGSRLGMDVWQKLLPEISARIRARSIPPGRLKRGPKALTNSVIIAIGKASRNSRRKVVDKDNDKEDKVSKSIWTPFFLYYPHKVLKS